MSAALRRVLVESWNRRGVLAFLLWPVSVLYGLLTAARKGLYQVRWLAVERVPVPVVVVGNVVVGGAGKTPVTMALVKHLKRQGLKAGVIARGYGRDGTDCREVHDDSDASEAGDEPLLIKRSTAVPVFVAKARAQAARALLAAYPETDILVCDDGLQHHALHRDLEICVFDERGIGNGLLLPAGPLREAWPRHVDLVLSSGRPLRVEGYVLRRSLASHAQRADGKRIALDVLRGFDNQPGAQLWAVAGIARPEAFFAMLRARGLPLARTFALPDHADFEPRQWPSANGQTLVCTEKDAVKLWRHHPDAWAVPLILEVEPAFWYALDKLLQARTGTKLSFGHGHTTS